MSPRKAGKSDAYSTALIVLYIMCDTRETFYAIRDNYIVNNPQWLKRFRENKLINFVKQMLELKLSPEKCVEKWNQISDQLEVLSANFLSEIGVDSRFLGVQDHMDKLIDIFGQATLLDA